MVEMGNFSTYRAPVKIVFLGLPLAACLLHADGHEIVLAGLSGMVKLGRRRVTRLIGESRVHLLPALDSRWVDRMTAESPDLLVSWFWTNKIPEAVLKVPTLGGLGVHPSLLPRHRGPDPTAWALLSGDEATGVTAHRLDSEYDTGNILDSEQLAIQPTWTAWDLAKALDRPSLRVLRRVVRRFASEGQLVGALQEEARATHAPLLDEETCVIRWSNSAVEIERLVRAACPAPGARMEVSGDELVLLQVTRQPAHPLLEEPGELLILREAVVVACGDGSIRIDRAEFGDDTLEGQDLVAFFEDRS